jgi:hypothetical protein
MKWIMQIMILVNLLTFAWYKFYQEPFVTPEKRALPEISKGVKTLRLVSELESIKDVSVPVRNPAESVSLCHTIGPFMTQNAALEVLADIRGLGREGNVRTGKQKVKYAYWVYLKSMPDDELEKVILELEEYGIKDYYQNDRNELSLGIYNSIEVAKQQQLNINALGFSPLVGPLYRKETQYWIEVADMNYRLLTDNAWETYLARFPDSQHKSTRCELINA